MARAQNVGSMLDVSFTPEGAILSGVGDDLWGARVRLERYGRAGLMTGALDAPARVSGEKVEFLRGPGVTEWYVNAQGGLEHGFTLERRPEGEAAELSFEVSLGGARAEPSGDGALALVSEDRVVRYENLRVWDARGRALDASMRPSRSGFVIEVDDAGAQYPVTVDPTFTQVIKFSAFDGAAFDNYGNDVDVSGGRAIVGSPNDDHATNETGSAYIYEKNTQGTWSYKAKLTGSTTTQFGQFGGAVSMDGDRAIVGALGENAAYVFERTAQGSWARRARLTGSVSFPGGLFGSAVAIDGDRAVVGAYGLEAVFVFERSAQGTWAEVESLGVAGAPASRRFGFSLDLDADTLVVGAPFESDAGTSSGAAYVYERSALGAWTLDERIAADDADAFDNFGTSVGVSDGNVAVGAPSEGNSNRGSVYVFEHGGAAGWSQVSKLRAGGSNSAEFGSNLDADGDRFVVGDPFYSAFRSNVGAAYVFERGAQGGWSRVAQITSSNADSDDWLGWDVGLDGEDIVAGAPGDDDRANTAGAVYFYEELIVDAQDDTASTDEDVSVVIDVLDNDTTGGNPNVGNLTNFSAGGSATVNGAGEVVYTPALNAYGIETFDYTVFEGGLSETATVTVTVASVNDRPVASPGAETVPEDGAVDLSLTFTDAESAEAGASYTFTITNPPTRGTLTGTAPDLTYTPNANFSGSDFFRFTVTDAQGRTSSSARVDLTVSPQQDPPLAESSVVSLDEDTPTAVVLQGRDDDGTPLTFTAPAGTAQGGVLSGSAPNLTYTPAAHFNGEDSFTFTVGSGGQTSAPATVTLNVASVNDAPVGNTPSFTTDEDTPSPVTLSGVDADGDSLTFAVVTPPTQGQLTGTVPDLIYEPAQDATGLDSFRYSISDGVLTSIRTVTISITPVNDAPTAAAGIMAVTDEDTPVSVMLSGSDVEDDASALSFAVTGGTLGAVTVSGSTATYTPGADRNGSDAFTFTVTDSQGAVSSAASVVVQVTAVNDSPTVDAASVTLDEDSSTGITLVGADVDADTLTFSVTQAPANGALSGTPPDLIYTPDVDFNGADGFRFVANDGAVDSAEALIEITVDPVNDAPVAQDLEVATEEGMAASLELVARDVDGDALTFDVGTPGSGTLSGVPPMLTYTPNDDFGGTDTFTFTATDGELTSDPATITVVVSREPNEEPVFIEPTPPDGEEFELEAGDLVAFSVAASDPDEGPLGLSLEITGLPGTASFEADSGDFTWVTSDADVGTYEIVIAATDGAATIERQISVVVLAVLSGDDVTRDAGGGVEDAGAPDAGVSDAGDMGASEGAGPTSGSGSGDAGCCATAPALPSRSPLALLVGLLGLVWLARRSAGRAHEM